VAQLAGPEQAGFLADLGLTEPALTRVLEDCYALLGLISFFTVGEDEVRAWSVPRGTRAQDAAATAQCACCDANGWVFFDDAAGRGVGAKCSHDLAKLQAFAQRQGLTFQRAPTAGARARG